MTVYQHWRKHLYNSVYHYSSTISGCLSAATECKMVGWSNKNTDTYSWDYLPTALWYSGLSLISEGNKESRYHHAYTWWSEPTDNEEAFADTDFTQYIPEADDDKPWQLFISHISVFSLSFQCYKRHFSEFELEQFHVQYKQNQRVFCITVTITLHIT